MNVVRNLSGDRIDKERTLFKFSIIGDKILCHESDKRFRFYLNQAIVFNQFGLYNEGCSLEIYIKINY